MIHYQQRWMKDQWREAVRQRLSYCIGSDVVGGTGIYSPVGDCERKGSVGRGGQTKVKLPALEVIWLEALESVAQSVTTGGTIVTVWKEWASGYWSQELIHSVHGTKGGCARGGTAGGGGARGGVKIGLTCCGGRP
jgi:hypothetical protein